MRSPGALLAAGLLGGACFATAPVRSEDAKPPAELLAALEKAASAQREGALRALALAWVARTSRALGATTRADALVKDAASELAKESSTLESAEAEARLAEALAGKDPERAKHLEESLSTFALALREPRGADAPLAAPVWFEALATVHSAGVATDALVAGGLAAIAGTPPKGRVRLLRGAMRSLVHSVPAPRLRALVSELILDEKLDIFPLEYALETLRILDPDAVLTAREAARVEDALFDQPDQIDEYAPPSIAILLRSSPDPWKKTDALAKHFLDAKKPHAALFVRLGGLMRLGELPDRSKQGDRAAAFLDQALARGAEADRDASRRESLRLTVGGAAVLPTLSLGAKGLTLLERVSREGEKGDRYAANEYLIAAAAAVAKLPPSAPAAELAASFAKRTLARFQSDLTAQDAPGVAGPPPTLVAEALEACTRALAVQGGPDSKPLLAAIGAACEKAIPSVPRDSYFPRKCLLGCGRAAALQGDADGARAFYKAALEGTSESSSIDRVHLAIAAFRGLADVARPLRVELMTRAALLLEEPVPGAAFDRVDELFELAFAALGNADQPKEGGSR